MFRLKKVHAFLEFRYPIQIKYVDSILKIAT